MMVRRISMLLAAALLSGCAADPVKYTTPSGKPEARFPGASVAQVSETIIRKLTGAGATLWRQTPNQLIFQDKSQQTLDSVLFGSRYDPDVYGRIRFTLFEAGGAVGVVAECAMVQNAGSAFERESDLTHSKGCAGTQGLLDLIGRELASR